MLGLIDTGIIFAYLALMMAMGIFASRRQDSVEDYFVAGGKLSSFSIACLWLATWVGGAAVVGGTTRLLSLVLPAAGTPPACSLAACYLASFSQSA